MRGVEEVECAAVVSAEVERLRLHIYVGRVSRHRGHLVGEEDRRRVEMLAHTVADHASQLLDLLFPHFHRCKSCKSAQIEGLKLGLWDADWGFAV